MYLRLGGGCQGCGAADVTLKQGIEKAIRSLAPAVGEILDTTDHAAGRNPYYAAGQVTAHEATSAHRDACAVILSAQRARDPGGLGASLNECGILLAVASAAMTVWAFDWRLSKSS